MSRRSAALPDVERLVASIPPARVAAQRWFGAKGRSISGIGLTDAARVPGDGVEALMVVLRIDYADGGADDYLLPAVVDEGGREPPGGVWARDGHRLLREPRDGEGVWTRIVAAIATDAESVGLRGRFRFDPAPALDSLLPSARHAAAALDERRLGVEQSNTSVVLGERLIYKSYRRLEAGENPDLEITAFLTQRTGFEHTPPLAGSVHYLAAGAEPCSAGMLQAYAPANTDGWGWSLALLRAGHGQEAIDGVSLTGTITARMHTALASRPGEPAFPARPATDVEAATWRASGESQLAQAISAVSGETHRRMVELAPAVRARFADAFGRASASAPVSRVHGDYHLGQLLRVRSSFLVIDFEGEPARPLSERRQPQSPLRDVAGMLRSLDYAARTGARDAPDGLDGEAWLTDARTAFLAAYRSAAGAVVPLDADLLAAFELEKAVYEVRYEANNRPDWIWLPVAALERLVA
jgi:maltose alpha-D-glucosyltransferase / alpha-amylase